MTDQTPEEILDNGYTTVLAGDGQRSIRSKTGQEHLAALTAAGYRIVPIVDDSTRQEVEALVADQTPHVCVFCKGTGWIDDDGWSYYGDGWTPGSKPRERVERDGLVPCGMCGDWHIYRDERTEPTTIVDGWTREQDARAAELLATAYLGRND